VVNAVPIVFGGNFLGLVIGFFQLIRALELGGSFLGATSSPKVMAHHVMGVGNGGSHARVNLALLESVLRAAKRLEGMRKIMMGGEIIGSDGNCGLVERDSVGAAILTVREWAAFIGEGSLNPQPGIAGLGGNGVAYCFAVGKILLHVGPAVQPVQEQAA